MAAPTCMQPVLFPGKLSLASSHLAGPLQLLRANANTLLVFKAPCNISSCNHYITKHKDRRLQPLTLGIAQPCDLPGEAIPDVKKKAAQSLLHVNQAASAIMDMACRLSFSQLPDLIPWPVLGDVSPLCPPDLGGLSSYWLRYFFSFTCTIETTKIFPITNFLVKCMAKLTSTSEIWLEWTGGKSSWIPYQKNGGTSLYAMLRVAQLHCR